MFKNRSGLSSRTSGFLRKKEGGFNKPNFTSHKPTNFKSPFKRNSYSARSNSNDGGTYVPGYAKRSSDGGGYAPRSEYSPKSSYQPKSGYSSEKSSYNSSSSYSPKTSYSDKPSYNSKPSYSSKPSFGGGGYKPRGSSYSGGNNASNRIRPGGFSGGRQRFTRKPSQLTGNPNLFIKKAVGAEAIITEPTHKSFEEFEIMSPLKENIVKKGYTSPTPIQDQAIEPILGGRDLIGLAATGTGKTAAFLIPIINKIFTDRDQKALIIVPTRELAMQITDEFKELSIGMHLYSTLIIGGANMYRQTNELRRNPHVVIATPGRLKDLIERKALNLEDFKTIVLDEVDLMVDIGFINDVKYFINLMPKERQSLFFSATISAKIQTVLQAFVNDPVTVSVKRQDTSENVEQDVIKIISHDKKVDQLHDLLIKDEFSKVLIFGATKFGIEKLNTELLRRGFKTGALHGNKKQGHRRRVLESFKQDEIQILLATDVASRGLDIENVTHVINYDLPQTYEDYIHRIGRTGRAGKSGTALTFVD